MAGQSLKGYVVSSVHISGQIRVQPEEVKCTELVTALSVKVMDGQAMVISRSHMSGYPMIVFEFTQGIRRFLVCSST